MRKSLVKKINAINTGYSFLVSSLTGAPVTSGMPPAVSVELTNRCNLNCPECMTGSGDMSRDSGFMSEDLFGKIINELAPYLYNINLYFQGEPMLHPGFFSMLKKCRGLNSLVSTNGHFLSAENSEKLALSGLRMLLVSLDGMDEATYSAYRVNGSFSEVIKGIRNVTDAVRRNQSELKVVIQFLVNRFNEHQVAEARKFAREVRADLRLKSMQIISRNGFKKWLPSHKGYSRYDIKCKEYTLKSSLPDRCARLWFNPVITWNGLVLPCCFDKNASHIMGDLNEESFRDIWTGPRFKLFRWSVLKGRKMNEICLNCTSGLRGVRGDL